MAHAESKVRLFQSKVFKVFVVLIAFLFVGAQVYLVFFWRDSDPAAIRAQVQLLLNQAVAAIKEKDYPQAVALASKAIDLDHDNAEAYYRRGQAFFGIGLASNPMNMSQCDRGAQDYMHANLLDPNYRLWTQEMIDGHAEAKHKLGIR